MEDGAASAAARTAHQQQPAHGLWSLTGCRSQCGFELGAVFEAALLPSSPAAWHMPKFGGILELAGDLADSVVYYKNAIVDLFPNSASNGDDAGAEGCTCGDTPCACGARAATSTAAAGANSSSSPPFGRLATGALSGLHTAVALISAVECASYVVSLAVCNSGFVLTACCLYKLGACWGPGVAAGEVWRLVTPIFLHANTVHLISNMVFQLRFGTAVERALGKKRFVPLYFLSGAYGNLVSAASDPWKLSVGASTSGMGVLGSYLGITLLGRNQIPAEERQGVLLFTGLIVGLVVASGNDVYGHVGGFVGGLCGTILLVCDGRDDKFLPRLAAGVLALGGGLAAGQVLALPVTPSLCEA